MSEPKRGLETETLQGKAAIAAFFGWPISKAERYQQEWLDSGVAWWERIGRAHRKTLCAMRSDLRAWRVAKTQKTGGAL